MRIKALVVDRRSVDRNGLTQPLYQIGVRNVIEKNSEEILTESLKAGDYDMIFVEFNTLMDAGEPLARALRRADPNVPIVVTYPHTTNISDLQRYCPQASAFLVAPFTCEQLQETVEQCLSAHLVG